MDQISGSSTQTRDVEISAPSAPGSDRGLGLFAADRADEHFAARVLRSETGFYVLNISSPLQEGRRLVMQDGRIRYELEVMSCRPHSGGGFAVSSKVVACRKGDVRQEWRLAMNQKAKVTLLLSRQTYTARVKDSSAFGMGMEVPVDLETGTAVSIQTRDGMGFGEIRYSRRLPGGGYFAGLYLHEFKQNRERLLRTFGRTLRRTRIALAHSWRRLWHPQS